VADIPIDAQRVIDDLRASRRHAGAAAPKSWAPSESFESAIQHLPVAPVHLNEHMVWMHRNWDLTSLLAPPPARGVRGVVRRVVHRLVMAVFAPYFNRLQDYLGVNLRALDDVAKRTDDNSATQLRLMGAVRADLVDFAYHVDERLNG